MEGLSDHYRMLSEMKIRSARPADLTGLKSPSVWLPRVLQAADDVPAPAAPDGKQDGWWPAALTTRIEALRQLARDFMPWCLPDFEPLRNSKEAEFKAPLTAPTPANAARYYEELDTSLQSLLQSLMIATGLAPEVLTLAVRLREELPACRDRLSKVALRLRDLAKQCGRLAQEMDFSLLVNNRRKLLSVGYDVASRQLSKSCYDLLASESRTAAFIAVAKGEVVQESWFRLGRQHTACEGQTVLISWTGTMFEYLMPVIWMKSHPDTLLDRAASAAVRAQQTYAAKHTIPWGISEAAYSKRDQDGNYQYAAFGVPGLALNVARAGSLVVSPYSSCLGLLVDLGASVQNLLRVTRKNWLGRYGFYESADFTGARIRTLFAPKYELVRCWMSHHQGMSLAAICNVLHNGPFQRWFHAEPLVQASELILQERPLRVRPIADSQPRRVLNFTREKPRDSAPNSRASA